MTTQASHLGPEFAVTVDFDLVSITFYFSTEELAYAFQALLSSGTRAALSSNLAAEATKRPSTGAIEWRICDADKAIAVEFAARERR